MQENMSLSQLSDPELLSATSKLVGSQRELTAALAVHLAEVERRRLHLLAGFSSMFEFCVKGLRLSEGEAFRRIVAARLSQRFPVVPSLIASGAVHLSALELLRDKLTDENHAELLEAASGKTKREVEAWLAARFSRRAPRPSRIQPLSESRFKVELTVSAELKNKLEFARDLMSHANPSRDLAVVVERAVDLLLERLEKQRAGKARRPRAAPSEQQVEQRSKPGRITRETRRKVFERDGLQCSYVAPDGRRCEARAFLELDHAEPRALGGADDATNVRVRCRAHNQLWAEHVFGRERVERCRHFRQQKCRSEAAEARGSESDALERRPRARAKLGAQEPGTRGSAEGSSGVAAVHGPGPRVPESAASPDVSEGARPAHRALGEAPAARAPVMAGVPEAVRRALAGMGFRDTAARRAIAEVER